MEASLFIGLQYSFHATLSNLLSSEYIRFLCIETLEIEILEILTEATMVFSFTGNNYGRNTRSQYHQRNLGNSSRNSRGNPQFRTLDEAINLNEMFDFLEQRISNNNAILGEPPPFITDANQIAEVKRYVRSCITNFFKEHRELGNLYMDQRYDPSEGKWSGCPMFAAQFLDKQSAFSKLGKFMQEFRYCVRHDLQ